MVRLLLVFFRCSEVFIFYILFNTLEKLDNIVAKCVCKCKVRTHYCRSPGLLEAHYNIHRAAFAATSGYRSVQY